MGFIHLQSLFVAMVMMYTNIHIQLAFQRQNSLNHNSLYVFSMGPLDPLVETPPPLVATPPPLVATPPPLVETPPPLVETPPPLVVTPPPLVVTPPPLLVIVT